MKIKLIEGEKVPEYKTARAGSTLAVFAYNSDRTREL